MPIRAILSTASRVPKPVARSVFCGRLHRHDSAATFNPTFRCNSIKGTIYELGRSRVHCLGRRFTWIVVPESGGFARPEPANGAPLFGDSIPVVHALIAVFLYTPGTTYKQFTGLGHRLGIPFTDLLKDCMVDPNGPNDMLQPFRRPSTQSISDIRLKLCFNAGINDNLRACAVLGTWLWSSIHLGCAGDSVQAAAQHAIESTPVAFSPVSFGSLHLLLGPYMSWG